MTYEDYCALDPVEKTRVRLEGAAQIMAAMQLQPFGPDATRMLGVVLWAQPEDGKAVIWAEDHGNLVFYLADDESTSVTAGDLVHFDLVEDQPIRRAFNVSIENTDLWSASSFWSGQDRSVPPTTRRLEELKRAAAFITDVAS